MQDDLSAKFLALGHPVRREILKTLSHGSATVGELAEPHDMSAPAISNHLKVLESAGLVERTVEAQHRRVSLRAEELAEVEAWVNELRRFWGQGFDRLEERLLSIRKQLGRPVDEDLEASGDEAPAPERRRSGAPRLDAIGPDSEPADLTRPDFTRQNARRQDDE